MRKSIILLTTFIIGNLLLTGIYSCNKNRYDHNCGPFETTIGGCAAINEITTKVIRLGNSNDIKPGETVAAEKLSIRAYFKIQEVTCKYYRPQNPFITSAYACTPPLPTFVLKDKINKVTIVSNNDFDASHKAGSDISSLFEFNRFETVNQTPNLTNTLDEESSYQSHWFDLKTAPESEGVHQFTVSYFLESGTVITSQTDSVYITK